LRYLKRCCCLRRAIESGNLGEADARRRRHQGGAGATDSGIRLARCQLGRVGNKWTFRTAGDLSWLMTRESTETRRLSRAAIEVLANHRLSPAVTRAEIEEIRARDHVEGNLDVLLETGWIRRARPPQDAGAVR